MKKIITFLKLIRFPNLFTAASNSAAAAIIVQGSPRPLLFVIGASVLLYAAGIIFNDYFDYETDKTERPGRPLPSGAVSLWGAFTAASLLMATGIGCAFLAGTVTGLVSLVLSLMILLYNSLLKRWLIPGALNMGLCRGLNWLMGLSIAPGFTAFLLYPLLITLYISLLTAVARKEVEKPFLKKIVILGLTALPVIDGLILLGHRHYIASAVIAAMVIPVMLLRKKFYMT